MADLCHLQIRSYQSKSNPEYFILASGFADPVPDILVRFGTVSEHLGQIWLFLSDPVVLAISVCFGHMWCFGQIRIRMFLDRFKLGCFWSDSDSSDLIGSESVSRCSGHIRIQMFRSDVDPGNLVIFRSKCCGQIRIQIRNSKKSC